jgi:hypothetical protein
MMVNMPSVKTLIICVIAIVFQLITAKAQEQEPFVSENLLRVHHIVATFAASVGETPQEFSERVHSSLENIEALLYAVEMQGVPPEFFIENINKYGARVGSENMGQYLECVNIPFTDRDKPVRPNESECTKIKHRWEYPVNMQIYRGYSNGITKHIVD